jgi:trehalose 6-phosphate phosphatase
MTELFSAAGQQALADFVQPGMLCLFDFDGTLSPLVKEPREASLPHAVQQRLHALQQCARVGIVTGRSLEDCRQRLAFSPDHLVGNHGLEGLPDWQQRATEFDAICSGWRFYLADALPEIDAGIQMEDKRYSLSLHYRHARDRHRARQQLVMLFGQLSPLPRVIPGKCVFSLLPPKAGNKGQAVEQLIALTGAARTLYVGDDVTDEDVFILPRKDLLTVRVGHQRRSAATYAIPDYAAIVPFLDQLLACLQAADNAPSLLRQSGLS